MDSRPLLRKALSMSNKKKEAQTLGEELVDGLRELSETVATGKPLSAKFTVRTVNLKLEPRQYDALAVKETREELQVSQAVFAEILAVSPDCVEKWEQGRGEPSPMACRLLDLINEHRDHWTDVLMKSVRPNAEKSMA